MSRANFSRIPMPLLAVVLIMGALGLGRSFFMLLLGWDAYQAGAVELKSQVFFIVHFILGMVVLAIAAALVMRMRWAWAAALTASIAMLIEEMVRSAPVLATSGGVITTLVGSAVYAASMVVVIFLLMRKSSRNFFNEAS